MLTWVDLLVRGDPVGVHDGLEAAGELVGLEVSGRIVRGLDLIQDGQHCGAAMLL